MNVKVLTCPNKKCGATLMYEIFVGRYIANQDDEDQRPESNKLNMVITSGYFVYKCLLCGQTAWPVK